MKNYLGIGIDIVNVKRFEKIPYKSHLSFYKKIFDESEIKYCLKHKNPVPHFAGKFAAKEAVIKSIPKKINMLDIITTHQSSKPSIVLCKNLPYNFLVSISHEGDMAVAVVISQKISAV